MRKLIAALTLSIAALAGAATPAGAWAPGGYSSDGVSIRTCAQTTCTRLGYGYASQTATIHCTETGTTVNGSNLWYYHSNNATNVTGYASRTLMYTSGPGTGLGWC